MLVRIGKIFILLSAVILLASSEAFAFSRLTLRSRESTAETMRFRSLDVRVEIDGAVARTTVDFLAFNPNNGDRTAVMTFRLNAGQIITSMALELEDGELRDASVAERPRARKAFDQITSSMKDPALLEVQPDGSYQLSVFPVRRNGARRVRLSYIETLYAQADSRNLRYEFPFEYDVSVSDFTFSVNVRGAAGAPTLRAKDMRKTLYRDVRGDCETSIRVKNRSMKKNPISVSIPYAGEELSLIGRRDGEKFFYREVRLPNDWIQRKPPKPKTITILWDASLSGVNRDHSAELAFLDDCFRDIGDARVRLRRVRDAAAPIAEYEVRGGNWVELRQELEATIYDGATDLGALDTNDGSDIYLLFTDGWDNFGTAATAFSADAPLFVVLQSSPARRAYGNIVDLDVYERTKKFPWERVFLASIQGDNVANLICDYVPDERGIVSISGTTVDDAANATLVFERVNDVLGRISFDIDENFERWDATPYLWFRTSVSQIGHDAGGREILTGLGTRFAVPTDETSLIVLERLEDYAAYGIPPPEHLRQAYELLRKAWRLQPEPQNIVTEEQREGKNIDDIAAQWEWHNRPAPPLETILIPEADGPSSRRAINPFMDIPTSHWTYDALRYLGSPSASPSLSRFEGAVITAQLIAKINPETAPKQHIDMLKKLIVEFMDELDALGIKTDKLDERLRILRENLGGWVIGGRMRFNSTSFTSGVRGQPRNSANQPKISSESIPLEATRKRSMEDEVLPLSYRKYLFDRKERGMDWSFCIDTMDVLLGEGHDELALRVLSNFVETSAKPADGMYGMTLVLMERKRLDLAIPTIERIVAAHPEDAAARRLLGLARAGAGEVQAALDSLYELLMDTGTPKDMEITLISEINDIATSADFKLNLDGFDPRLLTRETPVRYRIVFSRSSSDATFRFNSTYLPLAKESDVSLPGGYYISTYTADDYGPIEMTLKRGVAGRFGIPDFREINQAFR